jgi:glucose/arabinose dehydrogenase
VTERGGQLTKISSDGTKQSYVVSGTAEVGEGGLLGMALAPDFETSRFVYLYQTVRHPNGRVANRVVRAVFQGGLGEPQVVIDEIPGAKYHDGGRIAFGPDGMLYITTGDASESSQAQDTASLAGKILRLNPDGSVPSDNPFGNAVWSYGHRNPQGLAWDDQGRLWATEHGRSGISTGYDELNLIVKGGNYGWPDLQGDAKREGMIPPVAHSGPKVTWAPAGIAFYDGALYFAGLRGAALYRAVPDESGKVDGVTPFLQKEYGRLRAVHTIGNYLYVTTSNRDGRGSARDWDDQLLRFRAGALK